MPSTVEELRQLIRIKSNTVFQVAEGASPGLILKGFASIESPDRAGDVVPPEEFQLRQFKTAPALLVNHELWRDAQGNGVSAGAVQEAFVAKVTRGEGSKYGILDVEKRKIVHYIEKSDFPELKIGDRGLFVIAKVTDTQLIARIQNGEFGAFSWRGTAKVDYRVGANGVEKVLRDIDLFEVSLATIPANPKSTFVIGKAVQSVIFDHAKFTTADIVKEFCEQHSLGSGHIRQTNAADYVAIQSGVERFDRYELVKTATGLTLVTGEPRAEGDGVVGTEGSVTATLLQELLTLQGDQGMPNTDDIKKDVDPQNDPSEGKAGTETPAPGATEPTKEEMLKNFQDAIATKTAQVLAEELKPIFGGFNDNLKSLADVLTNVAKSIAPAAPPANSDPEPPKETSETLQEALKTLTEQFSAENRRFAEKLQEVSKTVQAIAKTPTSQTPREERVTTPKPAADPNAVFDSIFPFKKIS